MREHKPPVLGSSKNLPLETIDRPSPISVGYKRNVPDSAYKIQAQERAEYAKEKAKRGALGG